MKNIKVALVNPGTFWKGMVFVYEPIGLGYIASYLEKNGIEVKIIDEIAGQNVKKEIKKFNPNIVGITANTLVIPDAYRIADICKEMGIRTVIGGTHASALPEEVLKHADIVVVGEGESAMLKIINENIKSGIVSAPYIENLDDIPILARHLIDMDFYFEFHSKFSLNPKIKSGKMITSRGCSHKCLFCRNSFIKAPSRSNSAERVVSEMKFLIDKYKVENITFYDDNFLTDKDRVEKICDLIKENNINIKWFFESRADSINPRILKKVKEAGCYRILFGFESGSQKILNFLGKEIMVEQNQKAIDLCKEAGIFISGFFMVGSPIETIEDIEATKKFVEKNSNIFPIFHVFTPYPGTKFWELYKKNNILSEDLDWSRFVSAKLFFYLSFKLFSPKFSEHISVCDFIPKDELKIIFNQFMQIEKSRYLAVVKNSISYKLYTDLLRLLWLIKFGLKHPHTLKNKINQWNH